MQIQDPARPFSAEEFRSKEQAGEGRAGFFDLFRGVNFSREAQSWYFLNARLFLLRWFLCPLAGSWRSVNSFVFVRRGPNRGSFFVIQLRQDREYVLCFLDLPLPPVSRCQIRVHGFIAWVKLPSNLQMRNGVLQAVAQNAEFAEGGLGT